MKNLIIAPHIDDEILGCFAVLNEETSVCYLGVEDRSYVSAKERVMEMEEAARAKRFKWTLFNNTVNSYRCEQMISILEEEINRLQPEQVFIPNYSYNQDHRAVYDAAIVALRHHDINWFVKKVFIYEQPHTILWPYSNFTPNFYFQIDISEKIRTYGIYKSQVRAHRSADCIETMARLRGKQANIEYAEAFQCLRYVY
jgi:LmbE family N-acetylglucosaminyl deacetylase